MSKDSSVDERQLDAEQLLQMNASLGLPSVQYHVAPPKQTGLIKGQWSLYGEGFGLSMHGGEFEELSDVTHSLELPAGLSLTFMLGGQVSFALAGRRYMMTPDSGRPSCMCFALAKPDLLTRYMQKGQRVRKLNIFVEKSWLQRRFRSTLDLELIERLFSQHALLNQWQPSESVLRVCHEVLRPRPVVSVSQQLSLEARILELLGLALEEWASKVEQQSVTAIACPSASLAQKVKQSIDVHCSGPLNLQALADEHHVSVSTLQRHFKSSFDVTVASYIRQRQLERARAALVCDGKSIGEAAYIAGYAHVGNFITAFTKAYAISPAKYRSVHLEF